MDLLKQLNKVQRDAVEFCDAPSLIIAGAGSGKTRVLTYKIAYLLELGLPSWNILALTFTNKAAREMKTRIVEIVGEKKASKLWMGTFHQIFARILRYEAQHIGFNSNYTIFDTSDSKNLIKSIIKSNNLDDKIYNTGLVFNQISRAKNVLIDYNSYINNREISDYNKFSKKPLLGEIYKQYQTRLMFSNSMDFDDLLFYTNTLFDNNEDILQKYRNQFQYILVDEYQDTNLVQDAIIKKLSKTNNRVCVVGDDAQSIYSFRGANIDNILRFKSNFSGAKIFKLEQNYRSTQNIINAANSLIKKNKRQIFKNIYTENENGDKVDVISAFSDFEEGIVVSNKILQMHISNHSKYSKFAILYRTNSQSRIFEEALRKNNISYQIYGGLSFYQRKEIKDIVGYFRLIVNSNDNEALMRVINYPARGIGNVTIDKIASKATSNNVSMWNVILDPHKYQLDINKGTMSKIVSFTTLINEFIENNKTLDAFELTQKIIKETGISREISSYLTPEAMTREQNIQELINAINEFVSIRKETGEEKNNLVDFLSEVSLLTDQDLNTDNLEDKVSLMTIHASKGLEFDHVFIVGLEDDLFPSKMSKTDINGIEEERRLLYVALTRAKKTCTITYAHSRFKNGVVNSSKESPFLKDIDSTYLSIPTNNKYDFWSTIKERDASNNIKKVETKTAKIAVNSTINNSFDNTRNSNIDIKIGDIIEHDRFGRGVITAIEINEFDERAFVDFESSGKKQLLLKFAKFRIL